MQLRTMALARMALLASALISTAAAASDFGLYTGVWSYNVGGDILNGGSTVSLDGDSGIKANPQAEVQLHYGFSDRIWPGLTAGYVHLGAAGQYLAPASFQFGGIDVVGLNTRILAGINVNDYDLYADWRLLSGHNLTLEPGLALKYLNGHGSIIGTTTIAPLGVVPVATLVQQERFAIDQPVPMAHLRSTARPWDWLRLEFDGGYIAYEGQHVGEMRALAGVSLWRDVLFLSAGYHEQIYKVKEAPYTVHARLDGPTLGLSVATP